MADTQGDIIAAFDTFLGANRGKTRDDEWYVGIASDPLDRLTNGHGLDGKGGRDIWISRRGTTHQVARVIERH